MKTHLSLHNTFEFLYQMLLITIGFESWKTYIGFLPLPSISNIVKIIFLGMGKRI